jgi:hypothetical protein
MLLCQICYDSDKNMVKLGFVCYASVSLKQYVTWEFNIFNHLLKTRNSNKHGYTATSTNKTNKATFHRLLCCIIFNHTKIQQHNMNPVLTIF